MSLIPFAKILNALVFQYISFYLFLVLDVKIGKDIHCSQTDPQQFREQLCNICISDMEDGRFKLILFLDFEDDFIWNFIGVDFYFVDVGNRDVS